MLDRADSLRRLEAELGAVELDVQGTYNLDTSQYAALSLSDVGTAVKAAGYNVVSNIPNSAGRMLVLAYPRTTTLSASDGPFVPKAGLSHQELNWARERHKVWSKKFNRQFGLAFLHGFVGFFAFAVALNSFDEPGSRGKPIALAIAVIVLLLFAVAVFKAIDARRKRWDEIGHLLER
ncbi:hypothetical protein [Saccharopolyspora dendranthemae]|uniref:Uncharacterized protein n=1 Tax=Saccharopolyspora dendranthemae TaxID=1181886 RepID=A0A561V9Q0_9PSEU|nr:hypothetical protein [Saccharopolyspora dendranthemae]TWG08337.1 hypothetical protein FHU35_11956 [Saccharopolyspora dendranthemae]